jgi:hypothetical protein
MYLSTADNTFVLVISKAAFITDSDEGGGANVGVADWAFAITLVAETSNGNACLLAAHNKIADRDVSILYCRYKGQRWQGLETYG